MVGDIILIETGMRIPADCVLIEGQDISADETIYNEGRSVVNIKTVSRGAEHHLQNPDCFLLAQSLIMTGSGRAVVAAVGTHTRFNQEFPAEALNTDEQLTPLQERLEALAGYIGSRGYIAGAIIFISMTLFLVIQIMFTSNDLLDLNNLQTLLRYFSIGVSIVIVAVPEGLPLAVSIAMAFSVDTMKKDNLVVKRLEAPESLGYIHQICTGKTATLTKNDMTVNRFYIEGKSIENFDNALHNSGLNDSNIELLKQIIILNCDARVEMSVESAKYLPEGNGTEVGMLRFLQQNEVPIHDKMIERQRVAEHECSIPFGPIRKRQVEVYRPYNGCEYVRVVVKGAPEYVMDLCDRILDSEGYIQDLSQDNARHILQNEIIDTMAKNGLRTLAYAYKDLDSDEWERLQAANNNFENESDRYIVEQGLVFVAAFGLNDELRDGVKDSIERLEQGKITTRMVSGDNQHTAIACALKAGILRYGEEIQPGRVMIGQEFFDEIGGIKLMRDKKGNEKWVPAEMAKFKKIAQHLIILARSTPEHKFALVAGLKELGINVAMTADGINDAKALKHSNVGFCMGISGCEVAKDASDIIILDDNFNSVFRAVQWGRNILDNIRKFIQFQLSVNVVCIIITFLGGATLGNPTFSVIQLLWINMIMDTLAAISLATEPPHPTQIKGEKQKKTDRIILPVMWRNIIGQVTYQLLVLIIMLYTVPWWFNKAYDLTNNTEIDFYGKTGSAELEVAKLYKLQHYTMIFHTFVLMSLFNQIASRKIGWRDFNIFERFFNNFKFLLVVAAEFGFQYFVVEFGGTIFRTSPLAWDQHLTCLCFGFGALLVNLGLKFLPEGEKGRFLYDFNETGQTSETGFFAKLNQLNKKEQVKEPFLQ